MNKLRLIKIYELRGEIHPIEQSIIGILDGIEKVNYDDHIRYIKDGNTYMIYDSLFNNMIINWMYVRNIFNMIDYEIKHILEYLLEKHLKINISRIL